MARLIFRGAKSGKTAETQCAKIQALTVLRPVFLCCSGILSGHTPQIPAWFLGCETRVGLPKERPIMLRELEVYIEVSLFFVKKLYP